MRTSGGHCGLDDYPSATVRHAVSVVDWLVTIPRDGHTVRTGGKQLAIAGPLTQSALRESLRLGSGLVNTPGELHLLMAG